MKYAIACLLLWVFSLTSADAASAKCKKRSADVQKDLDAVGALLDSGANQLSTKSDDPLAMLKEWLADHYDADIAQEIKLKEWSESFDDSEAGTTYARVGIATIMGTGETWYADGQDNTKAYLDKLRAAARKLVPYRLTWGIDGTDQGWGGSPGTNVLLMDKECKVVHSLFLGISHD